MSKINETIARLDRTARRIGLDLTELAVNRRGFEFGPTGRWLEFKPGGKGIVQVTAFTRRGGPVEAIQHKDLRQAEQLLARSLEADAEQYIDIPDKNDPRIWATRPGFRGKE
jgi:hypothetical protein